MHVVFINRFYYPDHSATAQLLRDLAVHLVGNNHRVSVITSSQTYNDQAVLPKAEKIEGVNVIRIPGTRFGRASSFLRFLDILSFHFFVIPYLFKVKSRDTILVSKTDPPLIHVIAQVIARLKGIPHVVWLQDIYPELLDQFSCGLPRLPGKFLVSIRNWALQQADTVVVIGNQMQEHVKSLNLTNTATQLIPNWNPSNSIRYVKKHENLLITAYNPNNKFVVLYSGNLGQVHDYETFLAAAIELEKHETIEFVFVGSGAKMTQLKLKCQQLLLSNVRFYPYQPLHLVSSSLSCADISLISLLPGMNTYVYPSKLYGALAVGKPVLFVGDHDSDLAQELIEYDAGVQVGSGEAMLLVDTILDLSRDTQRQQSVGENAANLYNEKYRYGLSLQAWEQLLTQIQLAKSTGNCTVAKLESSKRKVRRT